MSSPRGSTSLEQPRYFILGAFLGLVTVAKDYVDSARSCRWLLEISSFLSFHHLLSFFALLESLQKVCSENNLAAGTEVINKHSLIATHEQSCRLR